MFEQAITPDVSPNSSPQPLTETEAAVRLGLKVSTLRAWRHQKRGPAFVRLGRAVRYLVADIEAFLNANKQFAATGLGEQLG